MTFQRHILSRRVIADLKKRSITGVFFYMLVPFCPVCASHQGTDTMEEYA